MQQSARTRTRVLDTRISVEDRVRKNYYPYQCSGAPLPLAGTYPYTDLFTTFNSEETTNDIVTSDFQKLVAKGVIINNAYDNHVETVSLPPLGITSNIAVDIRACSPSRWLPNYVSNDEGYRNPSRIPWTGGIFLEPPDMTAALNQAISVAVTEAWANIDSSEILALVSVLEGEKTLQGLVDTSRRLYKFARNVKRLQLHKLKSVLPDLSSKQAKRAWRDIKDEFSLDALADRYLEVRYGLRPLYYDMMGALKAFFKEARLQRHTYRGRQSLTSHTADTSITVLEEKAPWFYRKFTLSRSCDVVTEIRAGVLCEVDYDSLDPWGLQSVAESMWDLMPYSFIIDWFFNVGDTIAAWTPNAGLSPRASWYKVKTTCTRTSTLVDARYDPARLVFDHPYRLGSQSIAAWFDGPCFKVTKDTYRVPHGDRFTLPTMTLRLNAAKLLDLAAITRNVFYGGSYPLITRNKRM